MKYLLYCFLICFGANIKVFAAEIIAIVDRQPVTTIEMQTNLRIAALLLHMPKTKQQGALMKADVLNYIVEEKMIEKEAKSQQIHVTAQELETQLQSYIKSNNYTRDSFMSLCRNYGVDIQQLLHVVRKEMLFTKLVQNKIKNELRISSREIASYFDMIKNSEDIGRKPEVAFRLSELVLSNMGDASKVFAEQIQQKLERGVNFKNAVKKLSVASSKKQSGDLGWVNESHLSSQLKSILMSKEVNTITPVLVKDDGNFVIFKITDIRVVPVQTESYIKFMTAQDEEHIGRFLRSREINLLIKDYLNVMRSNVFVEMKHS